MRKLIPFLLLLASLSPAAAQNYGATAGSGLTFGAKSAASVLYPYFIGCDATTVTQCWAVDASGRLTVNLASGSTVAATQSGTWSNVGVTGTFWPYTLGQQVAGSSVPIVLTAAQLTTLTPPAAITNYANETGGNLAALVTGINIAKWDATALGVPTAYGTAPSTGNYIGVNAFVTNSNANGQATATNSSPVVLPAAQVTADVCSLNAKTNLAISQNGTSSVQLIPLSGSTKIYVCSLFLMTNSTATTAAITTGTGTACVSSNAAVIGSTTANIANSINLIAGAGFTLGNGAGTIASGAASSELCMILGANVFVSGNLTYVQQ